MKAVIFILGILFVTGGNAQKFDCSSKINAYKELLKATKIGEAFEPWSEVQKNCPKESEAVYTDGIQILQYKIEVAAPEDTEKSVRDLMKLYDQFHKNFPASVPDFEVRKAMLLVNNKIDAKEEIFGLLDSGFSKAFKDVADATAIYTYFSMYADRFKEGDKKITSNSMIEKYSLVSTVLNSLKVAHPENREYTTAQQAIDRMMKDIATCESLSDYYTQNFEKNQNNADWLTSALVSLSEKCAAKPIFLSMAEKLHALKPSAASANFLAVGYTKQRKFAEAIAAYNQSAELQTNPLEKAKIYYTIGTTLLGTDFPKSKEYLNKALAANPKMGRAYLFLAQQYINGVNTCGNSEFERKAVYNLAIQTLQKVGIAEPQLKGTADKMIEGFAAKAATSAEIAKAKMNGKSFTIGCWINETITFPEK